MLKRNDELYRQSVKEKLQKKISDADKKKLELKR
jgi:hypothetical protein